MKRFTTLLCLLALAAVPAMAAGGAGGAGHHGAFAGAAAGPGGDPAAHLAHLDKVLGLTDAQIAAAKPLRDQLKATVAPLFTQLGTQHQQIKAALDANADAATVGELVIAAHALQGQVKAAHDQYDTAFAALLTADQLAKWNAIQAERQNRPDHPGFGLGRPR